MIQFLHSGLQGAPTQTASAGSICAILDACLVDGFNAMAPITVTVSAGVATLVYASQHGYNTNQYIRITGAAIGQLNGEKRPTILDSQSLTVPAPGAPDGPVGGAVTTRFAPLGWSLAHSATNVRAYRQGGALSDSLFFRVSNTGAENYSVTGYETMTDASTGTGAFGGQNFLKTNGGTTAPWLVVGDDRTVWLFMSYQALNNYHPGSFGDFNSFLPVDPYSGVVFCQSNNQTHEVAGSTFNTGHRLARDYLGSTANALATNYSPLGRNSGTFGAYPSPVSGGLTFVRPVLISESDHLRGAFRGLMHVWGAISAFPFVVLDGIEGIDGRVLLARNGYAGAVAFPLDEPW